MSVCQRTFGQGIARGCVTGEKKLWGGGGGGIARGCVTGNISIGGGGGYCSWVCHRVHLAGGIATDRAEESIWPRV